ncbi:MAG: hypothetical protein KTR18_17275 [Acidiferrobacterales bacterium]|nr:hypothetical protein [Acidiferrobacterales bacterium]
MKLVAEESIVSPVVNQTKSNRSLMSRYDAQLISKIDAEIILVRNYGLAAVHALSGNNELEFAQRLKHFKLALKSHLKKVSAKLYMFLREELKNDSRGEEFSTFQKQITTELSEVAKVLVSVKSFDWSEKEAMKTQLSDALTTVIKIHQREKLFLHPIYADVAEKRGQITQHDSALLAKSA